MKRLKTKHCLSHPTFENSEQKAVASLFCFSFVESILAIFYTVLIFLVTFFIKEKSDKRMINDRYCNFKKSKLALFFTVAMLLSSISQAQILNIESFRIEKDTAKVFLGNIGFGYSSKKQTVSVSRYNTNINSAYLSQLHSYMLLSNLALIKVSNQNVLSEGYAHFRINFLRKRILSPEQFSQIQYDKGRGMDSRFLTGLCMRWRIFYNETWSISANTGLMYEKEKWSTSTESATTSLIKSTTNITIKAKLTPTLSWFMITYYQARPDANFIKPRLITDTSLQFKINKRFAFNTQYVATYDDNPIINIPNLIYSVNSSILYNF